MSVTTPSRPPGEASLRFERARAAFDPLKTRSSDELAAAWCDLIGRLADRDHPLGARLRSSLGPGARLSPRGLEAAIEVMLNGVRPEVVERVFERARPRDAASVGLAVLAATPPLLVVQVLLPALARRSPTLFRLSSREADSSRESAAEPVGTEVVLDGLASALSELDPALGAAFTTTGARDERLRPEELAPLADRVVVFGSSAAIDPWRQATPRDRPFTDHGPGLGAALISAERALDPAVLSGLARDIALFDQRGCLSLQWVLLEDDASASGQGNGPARLAVELAARLAERLAAVASELPPGPIAEGEALGLHQSVLEHEMRGGEVYRALADRTAVGAGHVLLHCAADAGAALPLSPGLRTVHVAGVRPLERALDRLPKELARIQGVVLELDAARIGQESRWRERLREHGIHHVTGAGRLQSVDALWHNGGHDPLEIY